MDGLYTETYVKRGVTPKKQAQKIGIFALAGVAFLAGIVTIGAIGFALCVLIVLVGVILTPNFNVDFEYVFCDGQIDFDRISNGERRKTLLRIDLDNIEIMAPEQSHRMDSYRSMPGIKPEDFSSLKPDAVKYAIFCSDGDSRHYIVFEPDEKMIAMAKQKSPRKVYTD